MKRIFKKPFTYHPAFCLKKGGRVLLFFCLLFFFFLKPQVPAASAQDKSLHECFTILYTGDERGTIQPCG